VYLIGSDTFYYLAIADTLMESGSFITASQVSYSQPRDSHLSNVYDRH
jgi:hypothetical protein